MKKVKSIVMKVLAMMGENEVRAWGIGIKYINAIILINKERITL